MTFLFIKNYQLCIEKIKCCRWTSGKKKCNG